MKKKIFKDTVLLTSAAILLISLLLGFIFYGRFAKQAEIDLKERTDIFSGVNAQEALPVLKQVNENDIQVALLSPEGEILFENTSETENPAHQLTQSDIDEALLLEEDDSKNLSYTLETSTYYYFVKLTDGTILRTAKTERSIWVVFASTLPIVILVVILFIIISYILSKSMAKKIVAPLKQEDLLDHPELLYDEMVPFVRTITRNQEKIAKGNEKLKSRMDTINAIMENMEEGVVVLDENGEILSINKSIVEIFDVEDSMEGKNVLELLRNVDFSENIQKALKGKRREMLFEKDDHEYRILMSPVPGRGVIVFFLDISEKSEAERLRREFSANVSHELKTPLTSIYGNIELLEGGMVDPQDVPLFYEKISKETSRLIALIDEILLLSKLDEGNVAKHFEQVDLREIILECVSALDLKAHENQVIINVVGNATMEGSPSLLYELFYNLLDNAIKYNKPGGTVQVTLSDTDGKVNISVADTGIGVAEEDRSRIFERFYRADKSRSKKSGGTGLGLAIVKHAVLTHDGEIEMESELGEGTTFHIEFPE